MARLLVLVATLALVAVISEACTSSSGRTPSWDVGDSTEIYPTYDPATESVGVGVTVRFKRETDDSKLQVFKLIDASGDGYIDACEWLIEGGIVKNFVQFLTDDDVDGDEKISWNEFQKVSVA
uniref:Regeneration associated protein n=1 Tax=Holothuria glaberrima TaxID=31192 RepID=D2K927_HOLGL|nr:regeneration associated protein [Holothuria glaberrima]